VAEGETRHQQIPMTHHEPARHTPIVSETDVVVCGGGPAGVAAALAAARAGARTQLIEAQGCLGGIWTAGALPWILDQANKTGVLRELLEELARRGACQPPQWGGVACDLEALKLLLEEKCAAAGVGIRLHTRVVAAARAGRRLTVALTESKSGREAWAAKVFVDATGDGDLAAYAGCGFDFGEPGTGRTQPFSLLAILAGVAAAEIAPFVHAEDKPWRADSDALLAALKTQDVVPSYGAPILMAIHDNLFALMANHEYGVSALSAADLTTATLRARAEVHRIVAALRRCGGPWRNLRLVMTSEKIGTREGRRIHGRYRVTREDLLAGARHADAVCRVTFPVDVHSLDPATGKSYSNTGVKAQPYDIPLRALIAKDVDNLLLAGRCISGDFLAHASYRVTGNAVAMGEAAGQAAAAWSSGT
jgi:hypothetical protein